MVYMALIRKKKNEILHPPPKSPKIPSIVADHAVNKHVNLLFEKKKQSIQALWSHLVFVKISNQKKAGCRERRVYAEVQPLFLGCLISYFLSLRKWTLPRYWVVPDFI